MHGATGRNPDTLDPAILDFSAPVVFLPVRHHSPACARAVRSLIRQLRPAAVLIEGPSDFNPRFQELYLEHELPIAIYTYFRGRDGERRGGYYPFCVYSPEWQALQAARQAGIPARFLDLPWYALDGLETPTHLYADGELQTSEYVQTLCRRLGLDDFNALWDTLFEIPTGSPREVVRRCHEFCFQVRQLRVQEDPADLLREQFMAAEIRRAQKEFGGPLVIVTGGFHSAALHARLQRAPEPVEPPAEPTEHGIALTPYSYERLDSLTGYDSGMPNPGFYHEVWRDQEARRPHTHRRLLTRVARSLRDRGQPASSADLIAVEATARGLAALRGHGTVWRTDLVDGILGALVKDELAYGVPHPFLDEVHQVLRGGARGRIAAGAQAPPLVRDLRRRLAEAELEPTQTPRPLRLNLREAVDLGRSRLLHQVTGLHITGFVRKSGTDFAAREDLSDPHERWELLWSPDLEARAIEAAVYGPTLEEAAAGFLLEQAGTTESRAADAALILLQAALMGLERLAPELVTTVIGRIRQEAEFSIAAQAVHHLLYLYRYDETLGQAGGQELGQVLKEAWGRALHLLERTQGSDREAPRLVTGIKAVSETLERTGPALGLDRDELVEILGRVAGEAQRHPTLQGAAAGVLWNLQERPREVLQEGVRSHGEPSRLGDYLTGLFSVARETAQRQPELLTTLDEFLLRYSDEQFLEAVPSLRLAFSFFTPREKHHLSRTLMETVHGVGAAPIAPLEVHNSVAIAALRLEARLFQALERYGIVLPQGDGKG